MSQDYNATIINKQILSDTLIIFQVKPDFPITSFKPGQFAVLGLSLKQDSSEKLIKKAYSIASSPLQTEYLEFYIVLIPEGTLTPHLFALNVGDRLYLGPKITGKFTLEKVPEHKHILMIGTGTGLAPYMSMIRTQLVCGNARKFIILHGSRYAYELGYYQELSLMEKNCNNFYYLPSVSRPAKDHDWAGYEGRLPMLVQQGVVQTETDEELVPEKFDVFLCGNPDMIRDMTVYLQTLGFTPDEGKVVGTIHREEYW